MLLSCGDRGREAKREPTTPVLMARTQPADVGSLASALEVTKTGPKPRPQKGHFPDLQGKPWASLATLEVFRVGPQTSGPREYITYMPQAYSETLRWNGFLCSRRPRHLPQVETVSVTSLGLNGLNRSSHSHAEDPNLSTIL